MPVTVTKRPLPDENLEARVAYCRACAATESDPAKKAEWLAAAAKIEAQR